MASLRALNNPSPGSYTNAPQVQLWLAGLSLDAPVRALAIVRSFTFLLETRVKANASGRPGPRAPTGDYRAGINGKVTTKLGLFEGSVGTVSPQGRRLEYGFVGADSLGRVYNQPPYPHFGPAGLVTLPEFQQAMEALVSTLDNRLLS